VTASLPLVVKEKIATLPYLTLRELLRKAAKRELKIRTKNITKGIRTGNKLALL
jgi:hypothetical protein